MRSYRLARGERRAAAGLLALAALALAVPPAPAGFVVAPNNLAAVDGNANFGFPFLGSATVRYQQVYASSEFTAVAAGEVITQLFLRPDAGLGGRFTSTVDDIEIRLSTTARGPEGLSRTFADNPGADATLVYDGALTLSSADAPGPGNTRAFDIVITLQTPFAYDPTRGNLLLDIKQNNRFSSGLTSFDAQGAAGDSISAVAATNANATIGSATPFGVVTQFDFGPGVIAVPAPGGLALAGIGTVTLVAWASRRLRPAG